MSESSGETNNLDSVEQSAFAEELREALRSPVHFEFDVSERTLEVQDIIHVAWPEGVPPTNQEIDSVYSPHEPAAGDSHVWNQWNAPGSQSGLERGAREHNHGVHHPHDSGTDHGGPTHG
jgi:hypothetical protein